MIGQKKHHGGKRNGAGRRAQPGAKQAIIALRVSSEARAELAAAAKREGKTLSAWVLAAVLARYAETCLTHSGNST